MPVRFLLSISGLVLAAVVLGGQQTSLPERDESWDNLKKIAWDRPYGVVLRDGECVKGRILDVADQAFTLRVDSKQERTIQRNETVRIADSLALNWSDIVFSGRSSWDDAHLAFPGGGSESWQVLTQAGELLDSRSLGMGKDYFLSGPRSIPKSEVRSIDYVRFEPLTAYELTMHRAHLDLFAPHLWFRGAMLGKIRVRLYDSTLVEDNSPVDCRSGEKRLGR